MILSWQIAKRRIAHGERPGFLAAWSLVLLDGALLLALLALLWGPVTAWLATNVSAGALYALMFVIFFVPIQIVLITSAIWAVFSRWDNNNDKG